MVNVRSAGDAHWLGASRGSRRRPGRPNRCHHGCTPCCPRQLRWRWKACRMLICETLDDGSHGIHPTLLGFGPPCTHAQCTTRPPPRLHCAHRSWPARRLGSESRVEANGADGCAAGGAADRRGDRLHRRCVRPCPHPTAAAKLHHPKPQPVLEQRWWRATAKPCAGSCELSTLYPSTFVLCPPQPLGVWFFTLVKTQLGSRAR